MPQPMPPGAGGPPPGSDGPSGPQQGGGDTIGPVIQLMGNVDKALSHLNQVISSSKIAGPEDKQIIGQCSMLFGKLMERVQGGGADEPDGDEGSSQGQTVSPEAGGNKGAIPYSGA
jgi:hypothetical protein